ncbi:hypothetical protein [Segatella oris]|uniref:hypothetical protein n=1 Tax=Segatella oris TaxID=28135 RepID=UPI00361CA7C9
MLLVDFDYPRAQAFPLHAGKSLMRQPTLPPAHIAYQSPLPVVGHNSLRVGMIVVLSTQGDGFSKGLVHEVLHAAGYLMIGQSDDAQLNYAHYGFPFERLLFPENSFCYQWF